MLMPPLIEKWNVLKDEDKDLFPLLEVYMYEILKQNVKSIKHQLKLCRKPLMYQSD